MPKLSIQMLCTEAGSRITPQKKSMSFVRMQAISGAESVDNSKIEDPSTQLAGSINIDGLLKSIASGFDSGQVFTVTIDVTPGLPAAINA